ncbi:hypothetical protein HRW23_12220 [Streptomyces lunaelactis]|nr:hypothetical protein [Streptomyces lunaelactis]NUK01630.1 hypothetical protein [Streptomyces lunaelactis]NUK13294.1 hypothetical protein [Streptomyces lunaelactis]NUK17251.1 hypothetical protein [Streptomyces lunaelactis]NUK24853.1 hypothetical protein [Streptomyces lunaelactis]NUK33217.1 hypothetical protein [Streptomyces lunaelactis]
MEGSQKATTAHSGQDDQGATASAELDGERIPHPALRPLLPVPSHG